MIFFGMGWGTEIPDMERGNLSIEVSSLNEEESGSLGAAFDCGPQSAGASAACAAELPAAAATGSGPAANAAGRPFAAACNDAATTRRRRVRRGRPSSCCRPPAR